MVGGVRGRTIVGEYGPSWEQVKSESSTCGEDKKHAKNGGERVRPQKEQKNLKSGGKKDLRG